jgi:hypothetical protein
VYQSDTGDYNLLIGSDSFLYAYNKAGERLHNFQGKELLTMRQ